MTWEEKREEFIEWVDDWIDGLSVRDAERLREKLDELYSWFRTQ